jgi:hypothetical protein
MYTILICDDNSLMTTKRERIMQRSKLVDNLQFLVPQFYNEYDMSEYTVQLEYVLPCSKKYCTEILKLSNEMYQDHLRYLLPFNTNLTSEAGEIEIQLTFVKTELDVYGKDIQHVRKTSTTKINIVPIAAWSDIIPDSALSAIDERLIKLDAQIRAMDEMNQIVADTKADNIKYNTDTNELQLTSNGKEIGNKITLKTGGASLDDGVPVVDFNSISGGNTPIDNDEYNVVEF